MSPDAQYAYDVFLSYSRESGDDTAVLWDLSNLLFLRDHAAQVACTRSGGGFAPDEWSRTVSGLPWEQSCSGP